ncbi:MAG TPA: TIGR02996 domain-containing protein [Kofleriaceae bacterium]|nr:TIGR02996 domain-containing protein [Kofleriaceae bacterium]
MDRVLGARRLVAELVKNEQLEVRRAEIVGRDLAQLVETLGRPPSGQELEDWFDEHAQVTELYAGPAALDELVFRHLTPPPPPPEPERAADARHPELERQLREAPEQREPFLVYADWLQERGDPLGELIALGVAAAGGAEDATLRFERHLKLHEARFLGGLAPHLPSRVALRWRHGFVHAIDELVELPPARWAELLRLRICEVVGAITLHRPCPAELDAAIAAHAASSLCSLTLEGHAGRLPERLLARALTSLAVTGGRLVLGPGALPASLERLELRVHEIATDGGGPPALPVRELGVALTAPLAAFLASAQLPRLERLSVTADAELAPRLPALLESIRLPALTHLAIQGGALGEQTFGQLARLPLAAQLTQLSLTGLELTDLAMRDMAQKASAFPALAELDVSGNELSRDGLAAARALAPSVISRRQLRPGSAHERRLRRWAGSRLQAAEGIADPTLWRAAGVDGDLRWARYRGEAEYELYVSADLERYGCSCPSGIQPCKHVVALALVAERTRLPARSAEDIEGRVARAGLPRYEEIQE